MRCSSSALGRVAASSLLLSLAHAQHVIESLSFGHKGSVSQNGADIPGWATSGADHKPALLSDRVILTPPYPGNQRASLYSTNGVNYPEWEAELEFRASGPERASGNLNLWFTKDIASSLASLYTVERFDGLAIVIDQYGGGSGAIRGFLNDGTLSFRNHHNVDSMAFGQCDYSYRNLGRMSSLKMRQSYEGFEVLIDGQSCFRSDIVSLPAGYYFGISAATADPADSYEIAKFVVSSTSSHSREEIRRDVPPPPAAQENNYRQEQYASGSYAVPPAGGNSDEIAAKLQETQNALRNLLQQVGNLEARLNDRHNELKNIIAVPDQRNGQLDAIDRRIQLIESIVLRVQREVERRDYQETLSGLQRSLKETQTNLLSSLPQTMTQIVTSSTPKMGFFLFVIIAFQACLAGAYAFYKHRRNNSPKKFL